MERSKKVGLTEVLRGVVDNATSRESIEFHKMMGQALLLMTRFVLGSVLHPVSSFKATMQIGDTETVNRNIGIVLGLPRGRQKLQ